MRLPVLCGLIKRRILVNYRVDATIVRNLLPHPFQPKLHAGHAIAGICLIRLEQIRPKGFPAFIGLSSESAAHRIAVHWNDETGAEREGVFITRRDTGSWLNHLAGGRLFPGEHHHSHFEVHDDGTTISFLMRSRDGSEHISLKGTEADTLPTGSCFHSHAESSGFFKCGSLGYSVTRDVHRLDGISLHTPEWSVRAFTALKVESSFFGNQTIFPSGAATFDHALLMRDIAHEWHAADDLVIQP